MADLKINLGAATTDVNGFYYFQVNPNMLQAGAGTYQVITTFAGSDSYGSSSAVSAFTINSAAPTASPVPIQTQPPTEMYFGISTVAIIIAIAVATALMMLKKRP